MKNLIKPKLLKQGDKVATISLSWGGAGELRNRYEIGKKQLEETFGLKVIETSNALKSAEYLSKNPKARADDLMEAFSDSSIKAIISNIGGEDSIKTLPYIDTSVIKQNPKIFIGFSDTTITHFACYKAGLTSFYGTSIMTGFAENGGMHNYQIKDIQRTLFSALPVGEIYPNQEGWTSELLDWGNDSLQNKKRSLTKNKGWNFLQGNKTIKGQLVGGCVEVLEFLKGTDYWLYSSEWDNKVLFLETSEEMISPNCLKRILRNYALQGVFEKISGLIFGRPYNNKYAKEYNKVILEVIKGEIGNEELPIITEMDFGHTSPIFTIPYGVMAEINFEKQVFSIIENAVIE